MLSDSFCRMADLSLFSMNELLSFLASPVHHVLAGLPGTRGNATHCAINCIQCAGFLLGGGAFAPP